MVDRGVISCGIVTELYWSAVITFKFKANRDCNTASRIVAMTTMMAIEIGIIKFDRGDCSVSALFASINRCLIGIVYVIKSSVLDTILVELMHIGQG